MNGSSGFHMYERGSASFSFLKSKELAYTSRVPFLLGKGGKAEI
jgi:hypothetical protein